MFTFLKKKLLQENNVIGNNNINYGNNFINNNNNIFNENMMPPSY